MNGNRPRLVGYRKIGLHRHGLPIKNQNVYVNENGS